MAICSSCGFAIAEDAKFCEHCGQPQNDQGFAASEGKDPSTGPLFEVRIGAYFKTGWRLFLEYPAGFIGFSIIMILAMGMLYGVQSKLPFIGLFLTAALSPLHVGIFIVSAKLLQRRTCIFADFFAGFHYFQPLLIFGLIYGVLSAIGHQLFQSFLLLHLVYSLAIMMVMVLLFFTPLLVIDRRLGLWEALDLSRRTVQRRWGQFLGFIILGALLVVAGAIALGVGLLVTLPWFSCAITAAYADLFGLQSQEY